MQQGGRDDQQHVDIPVHAPLGIALFSNSIAEDPYQIADEVGDLSYSQIMARPSEILALKRGAVIDAAAHHGARNLRVFGSVAEGHDRIDSDIDLLVDFDQGRSLFDLMALEEELGALLGVHVDVVSGGSERVNLIARRAVDL